jgi:hypothetical protein
MKYQYVALLERNPKYVLTVSITGYLNIQFILLLFLRRLDGRGSTSGLNEKRCVFLCVWPNGRLVVSVILQSKLKVINKPGNKWVCSAERNNS